MLILTFFRKHKAMKLKECENTSDVGISHLSLGFYIKKKKATLSGTIKGREGLKNKPHIGSIKLS